ncbi:hypothetical protein PC116_g31203 [Phytophthora cactorum]|nr:hypothetical protein PC116_g31203 [Phytophthora cactorum]
MIAEGAGDSFLGIASVIGRIVDPLSEKEISTSNCYTIFADNGLGYNSVCGFDFDSYWGSANWIPDVACMRAAMSSEMNFVIVNANELYCVHDGHFQKRWSSYDAVSSSRRTHETSRSSYLRRQPLQ